MLANCVWSSIHHLCGSRRRCFLPSFPDSQHSRASLPFPFIRYRYITSTTSTSDPFLDTSSKPYGGWISKNPMPLREAYFVFCAISARWKTSAFRTLNGIAKPKYHKPQKRAQRLLSTERCTFCGFMPTRPISSVSSPDYRSLFDAFHWSTASYHQRRSTCS